MCCCLVNHSSRHSLADRSAATSFSSFARSSRSGSCFLQPPPKPQQQQPPPPRRGNFSTPRARLPPRPPGEPPPGRPAPPAAALPARSEAPREVYSARPPPLPPPPPPPLHPASPPSLGSFPGWLPLPPLPGCSSASRAGPRTAQPPAPRAAPLQPPLGAGRRPSAPRSSGLPRRLQRPAPRPPGPPARPVPRRPAAPGWLALRLPRLSPRPRRDQR